MGKDNDITDGLAKGATLGQLLDAGRSGDPLISHARIGELADLGLKLLETKVDAILLAQDNFEAAEHWASLLGDEAIVQVSAAWKTRWRQIQAILSKAKAKRGSAGHIKTLEQAVNQVLEGQGQARASIGALARSLDPALSRLEAPRGYTLDNGGVWVTNNTGDDRNITRDPIIVAGVFSDVDRNTERFRLAWRKGNAWHERIVDRRDAVDARALLTLSNDCSAVGSDNAAELARYLREFEAHNRGRLPEELCSPRLGWMPDGSFLLPGNGSKIRVVPRTPGEGRAFRGWGERAGTWSAWCETIEEYVIDFPLAMLGIYAALVPPLLQIVDADGCTFDWCGQSTVGKTTTLFLGASAWGKPSKRDGVVKVWDNSSDIGPTNWAACLHSLPVFLDDTQQMLSPKQREAVANMLYCVVAGEERTRGTVEGSVRDSRNWRLCMLTTGESPITSFSNETGARARALCLRGPPFGETDESKAIVEEVTRRIRLNYGHLGPMFLDALPRIGGLKAQYEELVAKYAEHAIDPLTGKADRLTGRITGYVALLHLAAQIAHDLGLPGDLDGPMAHALEAAKYGGKDADRPTEALREVWGYCVSRMEQFYGKGEKEPPQGWIGAWPETQTSRERIGIRPAILRDLLERGNYQAPNILEAWRERGWIRKATSGFAVSGRINGQVTNLITLDVTDELREIASPASVTGSDLE